jgi:hypothetical protein
MAKVKIVQIATAGAGCIDGTEFQESYLDDKGRVWYQGKDGWTQLELPDEPGITEHTTIPRREKIAELVKKRLDEYQQYWNPITMKFEIDKGTPNEWICSSSELIADIRKSVKDELAEEGKP